MFRHRGELGDQPGGEFDNRESSASRNAVE
jgi:hypothetical protein